jgi:hypothetical protein
MGGAPKKIKKVAKKIVKEVGDLPKDVEKKVIEPLERPVKKAINVVEKVGADIVEPLERPVKKLVREVKETVTGTDKYDYRQPEQPAQSPEITPEIVEDEKPSIMTRYATRGKRSGQAGTIMEGYGVIQRKKSGRAVT